jgi:hypothetical protein
MISDKRLLLAFATCVLVGVTGSQRVHAQSSTTLIAETADVIGARVLAADGSQIGSVADVIVVDSQIERIRITTDRPMGIGERIVELHRDAFTPSGKTIVLKISAKELRLLEPQREPEK